VVEEQLLTLSGLQAACLYVALPELQQQLLRFATGAAGADGLPGNGLMGWMWNAHWLLQQQLEGHTRLPAVGSLQEQLQAAVGSLVNLSRLLLLAYSMLQRGRPIGVVVPMMLPAPACTAVTATAAVAKVPAGAAPAAAVAKAAAAPAAAAVAKAAAAPAVTEAATAAAGAATVGAAAAAHGHQQHRPQAAPVHPLSPIQVLQLPLPDDADNQIMADIAAAVAAAQQTAEASYDPQQPRFGKGAGRYACWPELTDRSLSAGPVWRCDATGSSPGSPELPGPCALEDLPHQHRSCDAEGPNQHCRCGVDRSARAEGSFPFDGEGSCCSSRTGFDPHHQAQVLSCCSVTGNVVDSACIHCLPGSVTPKIFMPE